MNKKKILIFVIVIIFVIGICFAFIKLFDFENSEEENNVPEIVVNEELVDKLYSYLIENNEMELNALHSAFYTTYNTLSVDAIQTMIYQYIINYDEFALETLTPQELGSIVNNSSGFTPLYKISLDVFLDNLSTIFGPDITFTPKTFNYSKNIRAHYDEETNYYYIYNLNNEEEITFTEYKNMTRYALTENNTIIKIYDYYLKCDTTTNICYNDERRRNVNDFITYSPNLNIESYINNLVTYEHTFKYDTQTEEFYWVSSQEV